MFSNIINAVPCHSYSGHDPFDIIGLVNDKKVQKAFVINWLINFGGLKIYGSFSLPADFKIDSPFCLKINVVVPVRHETLIAASDSVSLSSTKVVRDYSTRKIIRPKTGFFLFFVSSTSA